MDASDEFKTTIAIILALIIAILLPLVIATW